MDQVAGGVVRSFDVATDFLRLVEAPFSDPNLPWLRPHVCGWRRYVCGFGSDGTRSVGFFKTHR